MKKSKTFARKVIAIVLSVMMLASSFTGVLTVFAKSTDDSHDANLAANFMAWAETTDEQTCEALLDYVDDVLQKANIAPIQVNLDYVVVKISINGYLDSVDGVLDLCTQIRNILENYKGLVGGDVSKINLYPISSDALKSTDKGDGVISKCNRSFRSVMNAKDIVMALAQAIYYNTNDLNAGGNKNNNVIGKFLKGELDLGIVKSAVDVYGLIGNLLGMWSGYQSNLVYNLVANIIFENTNWFTEEEIKSFKKFLGDPKYKDDTSVTAKEWNYDVQLFDKLANEFINKISVEMTYALEKQEDGTFAVTDSSVSRYKKIKAWLDANNKPENDDTIAEASTALGYDPNLRYDKGKGWIYIFRYGDDKLDISNKSTIYQLLDQALKLAWHSTLKPTLATMRVNNDMDWYEGHGGNFDNVYYYWLVENKLVDKTNWENNYTQEKFNKYCESQYAAQKCATPDELKKKVRASLEYDRAVVEDPQYNWRDLDKSNGYYTELGSKESILFGKLRYSPLADKVFNMQTGPINLYLMQTGATNITNFIEEYIANIGKQGRKYENILFAGNDLLAAAVKDFFPNSAKTCLSDGTDLPLPEMTLTNGSKDVKVIAQTLVSNACKLFEYALNATDENILNGFYNKNGITDKISSNNLTETNFEEAMIPLAVSTLNIIVATRAIHNDAWDRAEDAEGIAYLALNEYLSNVLPDKNYDQFVTTSGKLEATVDLNGDNSKDLYTDVILPMARDAVGYLLNSIVPCRDKDGNVWDVYKSNPATDKTTLFEILNSVVCYYASTDEYDEPYWNPTTSKTKAKAVASLLGVVATDGSGECAVKKSNTLWQNIDAIANTLWPVLSVLFNGTYDAGVTTNNALGREMGKLDSYKLVYKRVVESLFNIGAVHEGDTGLQGISTILWQVLTCFSSEPIMNKSVDTLVYDDVLCSLVNSIFGKRANGQYYSKVLPTTADMNNTQTPFDSLVKTEYIAKWKGTSSDNMNQENGVLGIFIADLYAFLGGNSELTGTAKTNVGNGTWQGAMFAVQAVASLVDGFLPQLGEHKFNAATVSVNDPTRSNVSSSSDIKDTYVTINNNAVGLNRFYKDANGTIQRDDRYFIKVKSCVASGNLGVVVDSLPADTVIAPEKSLKLGLKGKAPQGGSATATITTVYDVYLGDNTNKTKQRVYENQEAKTYFTLSTESSWFDGLEGATAVSSYTSKDTNTSSNRIFGTVKFNKNIVFSNTKPQQASRLGILGAEKVKGMYAAIPDPNKKNYPNAIVVTDSKTGDLLNLEKYDYQVEGQERQYGEAYRIADGIYARKGYTKAELYQIFKANNYVKKWDEKTGEPTEFNVPVSTYPHIALSHADVVKSGLAAEITQNEDGSYENTVFDYKIVTSGCATAATPTKNINFVGNLEKTTEAPTWLSYKDNTSIEPGEYDMQLYAYNDAGTISKLGETHVIIADNSGADTLMKAYQRYSNEMAPYQETDYKKDGSNDPYGKLQTAFQVALAGVSTPVTKKTAGSFVSKTIVSAKTQKITASSGDKAYKPATSVPKEIGAHQKGDYFYIDEDCTIPVYSNEELTDNDVKNGKDMVGAEVVKQNGTYYYANDLAYKYDWDTTTYAYPYYGVTDVEDTYEVKDAVTGAIQKKNYYNKTLHSYYTAKGKKANENENWAYTYAQIETITKPNVKATKEENRGLYAQLEDNLKYYVEYAKKNVDTSLLNDMIVDGIIKDRAGKYSEDYADVAAYEKMVQIAKQGEKLAIVTSTDEAGNNTYTTTASSLELKEANRLYKKYKGYVTDRKYDGNKLEAELKHLTGVEKAQIEVTAIDDTARTATVKLNGAAKPEKGALENGVLVNKGADKFSEKSWNEFVYCLAKAANLAKEAKDGNYMNTYVAKKDLVIAENALTLADNELWYTVSGTVYEAIDGTGTVGTTALSNVDVYVNGKKAATTANDGKFTAKVAVGKEAKVEFKGDGVVTRTLTYSDTVEGLNVGVVAVDYNGNGKIDAVDAALTAKKGVKGLTNEQFKSLLKTGVNYNATL
ncbi:hypothetical protein [uncultured Eubacterium sp.]|uniref:hypothetical protein n=1 Tax=uncultured Eubacterium sp. TaxID=165185 RepID=UPI0015A97695|nr:hypothetical protein [uncultured Eubacterium sp.]